jgi:hypothetical protein
VWLWPSRIIALEVAKSYGVLADVQESALIELVMAALVLYSQIASTEKIGVLPAARRDPRIDERLRDQSKSKVIETLSDTEIADLLHGVDDIGQRLRDQSVPTRTDAPKERGFFSADRGPFFDS